MINLIEKLQQVCDVVILDGPPTQLVTDSLILARIVDSTVVVTASNHTKKDDLRRIVENIQKVGGKVAGIVLNKVTVSAKKYEQSYYYGSTSKLKSNGKPTQMPSRKMPEEHEHTTNKKIENTKRPIEARPKQNQNTNYMKKTQNNNKSNNNSSELPKAIRKENQEGISLEKTNDILKQINQYLAEEKKNLNK